MSAPGRGTRAERLLLVTGVATAAVYGLFFLLQFPLWGHVGATAAQIPAIAPGRTHAVLLVVGWLLLGALYLVAYRVAAQAHGRRAVAIVLVGSLCFGTVLLFTYPFSSTDVFDYVARAHFAADTGSNPMLYSPASIPGYPYYQYITSVGVAGTYGPLWQVPADAIARVLGAGIVRNLVGMKLFVLACYWCGAPIVYWALRRAASGQAVRGLLLYAWNPLALIEVGANGHNDAVQVLVLVIAAAFVLAHRPVAGSVAVVAASLVKFSPLLILPLFLVAVLRLPTTWPRRLGWVAVVAVASTTLAALLYLPFGASGFEHNVADTLGHGNLRANSIVWSLVGTSTATGATVLGLVGLAIVAAVVAYHAWRLLRADVTGDQLAAEVVRRSFFALLVLLAAGLTWFWPWYVLWLLPFAALTTSRTARALMVVFTISGFAIHLSSYYQTLFGGRSFQVPLVIVLFAPLALTAAYQAARRTPALRPRPAS